MSIEITKPLELLDTQGHITAEGWARRPYWRYDRRAIRASKWRIKEWDYFSILSKRQKFGICLTMSDLGDLGVFAICFLDCARGFFHQVETFTLFLWGNGAFPKAATRGIYGSKTGNCPWSFNMW